MATLPQLITVEVKLRWWVPAYLNTLWLLASVTGMEPDEDKVVGFLMRWGMVFVIAGERVRLG